MKNLCIPFIVALLLVTAACTKKKSTPNPGPDPVPVASPYYFKFTLSGSSYNYTADIPQYMPFYANEAGGYEVENGNLLPSAGLRLSWPSDDTVKESDLTGLIGKTLYFSDTLIHPEVSFDTAAAATEWLSVDTANTSYNVKITNVTFLKNDTTLGYAIKTYVITGTCSAVISDGTSNRIFSGGSFNFIISRRDL